MHSPHGLVDQLGQASQAVFSELLSQKGMHPRACAAFEGGEGKEEMEHIHRLIG